jgi:hypothetical protein
VVVLMRGGSSGTGGGTRRCGDAGSHLSVSSFPSATAAAVQKTPKRLVP